MKIIDLSVSIEDQTPNDPPSMPTEIDYWDHAKGAEHIKTFFPTATNNDLPDGLGWAIEYIKLTTHSGTHLDAPWHYHPTMDHGKKAKTIDQMPLEWCISDGVMLNFSHFPAGYVVTAKDIQYELDRIGYKLKPLDIVLIQSGAQQYYGSKEYLVKGCGMGREATLFLLNKGIKVVGTDAWSWDSPLPLVAEKFKETHDKSIIWEGHFAGIEKEYYHLEKLTNLDKLPAFGFTVSCLPVKIKNASAGWTRTVAIMP
ncbi:cyclase family protein [uncultured Gilliamella sp.]|jgi:Predicted metal-dependent hydrolase|uniref:cyclase family protein n=1 Tax=uncultured Gilliamella sp. TaxID=1193505 RepID=UPI0025F21E4C|nr:cyclase family protein [uncultured Gilliamella sp.]